MGQEILYTSAPQGLRQGSSGFCTVGSTAGMEPNLAEFLEGFSGYPHPFKPPDPRTKDNPVNYSHIQWTIGGQRYHVLSRVCDAGLDHTGRTNLLAHHVALTRREIERCPGGPAHVMLAGDFFLTAWNKLLQTLPGQKPRGDGAPVQKCAAWQRAAGDAGYAGILAEAVREKGGRPISIIYPAGLDVLPLVAEALTLLPPDRRWNVTFATLYSRIYSSFDVQWRFLFAETTEAKQARREPHATVIDLCQPLPKATGGDLVTAAREGRFAHRPPPPLALREEPGAAAAARRRRPALPPEAGVALDDLNLAPAEVSGGTLASVVNPQDSPFSRARRRSVWLHYGLAGGAGALLALVAFLLLVVFGPQPEPKLVGLPPAGTPPDKNQNSSANGTEQSAALKPTQPAEPMPPAESPAAPPGETEPLPAEPLPAANNPPPPATPTRNPLEDIAINKQGLLLLPPRPGGGGLSAGSGSGTAELAQVFVASPADFDLKLVGKEAVFGADAPRVEIERVDSGPASTWKIAKLPAGALGKKEELGAFKLENQKLSFAWNRLVPAGARPESLRYCLLEVAAGGKQHRCRLSQPLAVNGLALSELARVSHPLELAAVDAGSLSGAESLRVEVRPVGLAVPLERHLDQPLAAGQEQRLLIKGGTNDDGPRIELTVRYASDEQSPQRHSISVTAKVGYRWPDVTEEKALKDRGGPFDLKQVAEIAKDYDNRVKVFEQTIKRMSRSEEEKDKIPAVQQERDKAQQWGQRTQALHKLMTEVAEKGRLEFRVYFDVAGEAVELYRSKGF